MRVTGREITEYEAEQVDETGKHEPVFLKFGEVCIEGGPKGLRKLAKFLNQCAKHMEGPRTQDHFHFNGNADDRSQIVVIDQKFARAWRTERGE